MSKREKTPAQQPRAGHPHADNPASDRPSSGRPKSAAQRASDLNREKQLAARGRGPQPADRRTAQPGEKSDAGLANDQRPVGVNRR